MVVIACDIQKRLMGDSPNFVETNILVTDKALGDIVECDLYVMLGVEKPDRSPGGWMVL